MDKQIKKCCDTCEMNAGSVCMGSGNARIMERIHTEWILKKQKRCFLMDVEIGRFRLQSIKRKFNKKRKGIWRIIIQIPFFIYIFIQKYG